MIKKQTSKSKMLAYLKSHNINYAIDIREGAPRYTMVFGGYEKCPDKTVESCIWFYENEMEVRTYYTETGAKWCKENIKRHPELMRLFNYINACVWMNLCDGNDNPLYVPNYLYTPRLYMTEDGCFDITLTTVIPYDFYESAPIETADYITAFCPELLADFSPAIFCLLLGQIDLETAKQYIQKNVLGNEKGGIV